MPEIPRQEAPQPPADHSVSSNPYPPAESQSPVSSAKRDTCSHPGCTSEKLKARGLCSQHYQPAFRRPPQSLKVTEVQALLAAASGPAWQNVRDIALIWLLYKSGLRIAEALALNPHDLDWSLEPKVSIFVAHGKGDRSRTVSLAAAAIPALKAWLTRRKEMGFSPDAPLFCSGRGAQLNTSQIRRLFRSLARRSGVRAWTHPHALRHTYAAEAARKKVRPELIQRQLGHSNLGTTTKYLATISPSEVMDALWDL